MIRSFLEFNGRGIEIFLVKRWKLSLKKRNRRPNITIGVFGTWKEKLDSDKLGWEVV